jgi:sugar/nucleoside kinase (ribokinase family)
MLNRFDVTIAGEINLDLILYGLAEQMPVERELIAKDFRLTLGSSSAIVAHNLAALGLEVGFITRVGSDELGRIALERLRTSGVDTSRTTFAPPPEQTGVTMLLHHGSTRHILTYPGTMATMSAAHLDEGYLIGSRHFHLSSIFLQKALQPDLPALCRRLRKAGLTISVDTNDDPEDEWGFPLDELLNCVDIFLPNEDEARRITGTRDRYEALHRLAQRVPIVAIKCGQDGSIVQSGQERWKVPSIQVAVVDTIGAGDSYNAGFLAAYLAGKPLLQCARMGGVTAALSVTQVGGTEAFRDQEDARNFIKGHLPDWDG